MTSVPQVTPITGQDLRLIRWEFFIGWVVIVAGLPWLFRYSSSGSPFSLGWAIGLTIASVPVGYIMGYRWLIGPLFCGIVVQNKSRHISS